MLLNHLYQSKAFEVIAWCAVCSQVSPNSLPCKSVKVVVTLTVVDDIPIKNVEYHKYLMVLMETKGEQVVMGRVMEALVVTRKQ